MFGAGHKIIRLLEIEDSAQASPCALCFDDQSKRQISSHLRPKIILAATSRILLPHEIRDPWLNYLANRRNHTQ